MPSAHRMFWAAIIFQSFLTLLRPPSAEAQGDAPRPSRTLSSCDKASLAAGADIPLDECISVLRSEIMNLQAGLSLAENLIILLNQNYDELKRQLKVERRPFVNSTIKFEDVWLSDGNIKITVAGKISAQLIDKKILMRINGIDKKYQAYCQVFRDKEHHPTRLEMTGFDLGANVASPKSEFSSEITISIREGSGTIIARALSTFQNQSSPGDTSFLCYGDLEGPSSIQSIEILGEKDVHLAGSATLKIERAQTTKR